MMIRIQKILDSIKNNPEDWENNAYRFSNKKTGTEIWIGNGFFSYGLYTPKEIGFNIIEKFYFHFAFKDWKENNQPKDFWDKLV